MTPPIEAVAAAIRETAEAEIMPRFRRLAAGDVREKKGPQDLVTTADLEAERRLTAILRALVPGSVVVGEEACEEHPDLLDRLGDQTAWLVDPVDGTFNFANGTARFVVIVGLVRGGETVAGWIHDPIAGETAWTARGAGAWLGERRLHVAPPTSVGSMAGSLGGRLAERLHRRRSDGDTGVPAKVVHYGCTGLEYLDLARGVLHFARYGGRMKPWDHAAGILMHHEAGGYSSFLEGGPYSPRQGILQGPFLLAPDEASWTAVNRVVAV